MKMGFLLDIVFGSSHGRPSPLSLSAQGEIPYHFEIYTRDETTMDSQYTVLDFPSYQKLEPLGRLAGYGKLKSPLYKGYLIDLSGFDTLEAYFLAHFDAKDRRNYRRQGKKLEREVNPIGKIHFAAPIQEKELDLLFDSLKIFLEKRFEQVETHNYELPFLPQYKKMFKTLVPRGEAVIFSQYDEKKPIGIGIGFVQGNVLYLFNIAFDIHYGPYGLGNQILLDVLEWCFEKGIGLVDMGRGDYFHKRKWVNSSYTYQEISLFKKFHIGAALKAQASWARNQLRYHLIALLKKMGAQAWARTFFKWKYRHWASNSNGPNPKKATDLK